MPRPNLGLTRTSLMLHPKHLDAMRRLAARRGTSVSELVRIAMLEFITNEAHRIKAEKAHPTPAE